MSHISQKWIAVYKIPPEREVNFKISSFLYRGKVPISTIFASAVLKIRNSAQLCAQKTKLCANTTRLQPETLNGLKLCL